MAGAAPQPGPPQSGPPQSRRGQSNSHIVALLSLKVLLLAFFILLNSLASFEEERRSAVVDSVREAFRGLLPAERSVNANPSGLDVFEGGDDVVDTLKQLFGSDLPLVELPEASGARVLQIDLTADDLFESDGSALRPDGAETLRLVAGVLADPRFARQQARIDVLYGLSGRASGLAGNRAPLLRAAAVVRALEREGLAPGRLSAGLLPDFAGKLRLHFIIESEPAPAAAGGEG
jgi:hypothetical protein